MGFVPIRDNEGNVTGTRFVDNPGVGTDTADEAINQAAQTDRDLGRPFGRRTILGDPDVPGEGQDLQQAGQDLTTVRGVLDALRQGLDPAQGFQLLSAILQVRGEDDPAAEAQKFVRNATGVTVPLPTGAPAAPPAAPPSGPTEGLMGSGGSGSFTQSPGFQGLPSGTQATGGGGAFGEQVDLIPEFSLPQVFRQFIEATPGASNPFVRSALFGQQTPAIGQFLLSGQGAAENPEDQFTNFREFLGDPSQALRGNELLDRFRMAAQSVGSEVGGLLDNPLLQSLAQTFSNPSNQLTATQSLFESPAINPRLRGSISNALENEFFAFLGNNPTGNFLQNIINRNRNVFR